ncbi:MAG: cell division protein FtsK [Planctomycetes bacterium]|nr:cell division protein FtsK [Planctomycetota bacterium]
MMVPYSLDVARVRAADFQRRLAELLQAREKVSQKYGGERWSVEVATREADAKRKRELEVALQEIQDRLTRGREFAAAEQARLLARAERGYSASCARTREKLRLSLSRIEAEETRTCEHSLKNIQEKYRRVARRIDELREEATELGAEAGELEKSINRLMTSLGISWGDPETGQPLPPLPPREEVAFAVRRTLDAMHGSLAACRRTSGVRVFRTLSFGWIALFLLLGHAVAVGIAWYGNHATPAAATAAAGASFVAMFTVSLLAWRAIKWKVGAQVRGLAERARETAAILRAHDAALKIAKEGNDDRLLEEKVDTVASIQDRFREEADRLKEWERSRLDKLKLQQARLAERTARRRERRTQKAERRHALEELTLLERGRCGTDLDHGMHAARARQTHEQERQELKALGSEWRRALEEFLHATEEARRLAVERHPSWIDPRWEDPKLTDRFPDAVYLGDSRIDLKELAGGHAGDEFFPYPGDGTLAVPLALTFPSRGSFLLSVDSASHGSALKALSGTLLRILASFPPGKAKFLIIDPVGLGQSFSALMHLADYDESLVGGRIWTEPSHIEKKLSELTEHIEKVIQKYLRNRYASIAEYNSEVGVMAEPYRFLVVADFPMGFSDISLDRLASILTGGPRCGVYTLILHDARQKLPASIDGLVLRQSSLTARAEEGRLLVTDDVLPGGVLEIEIPPASERLTSMLNSIGRRCAEAKRVEVPFEVVAPKDDEWWSLSTERGIRVPLGRAGADRLQHLDLGRGTAQHALIAGKTGSGKSTLFHVMIVNLASWYGPRELEFYLIDYKKGVEFKTYAANRLPHARVVAIESDREFGLSVLQRIDREFARRAELYRKAGVQDFASYRRAGSGKYLPRTLLMIDEFQEFFVEEDGIAQEAALLLDRIVRQGRAFGVHVVLGSQTLGGSYSLAKATLGQMGVRIALQCNEADSYLILSDDNAAARLLSRPGEAIYNDLSGTVEGNNPFQIVWLDDQTHERQIVRARERAEREGWQPDEPTTVFEGNVPADIRSNAPLRGRIESASVPEEAVRRAWLGEANAIKGPTEVCFRNQGGSNLLIVGQQREAAMGVLLSVAVGVAAAHPPRTARFVILDGSPPELGYGMQLKEFAKSVPQQVDLVEYARVPEVMEELDADVKDRQDGGRKSDAPVILAIFDLSRFRKLRQGDEYDFSSAGREKPSPDKCLANVLAEGPAHGVHTIVWCDSLANLNRAFTRMSLREFEMRVLFQMSPTDSSELIDSPEASKLGLHQGLLFVEQEGTIEKFRPYGLPDPEWMDEVRSALFGKTLGRSARPE